VRSTSLAGLIAAACAHSAAADPPAPGPRTIDFGRDEPGAALGERHTAPPPDVKHPSLLSDKYRGVADPGADGALEDPLAARDRPAGERSVWLGARLAGGMFDDAATAARPGLALAVAARYRLRGPAFVAARADWSRRGGDVMAGSVDVLGASAGLGLTITGRRSRQRAGLAVALIGQLRGDLRLADARAATPVHRTGLGLAAGAELALPATPFTAGIRFEQGLTDLVAGARDRAVLAEIGIDLR
jgi:hypothetical protein